MAELSVCLTTFIAIIIKSRKLRWAGHVVRIEDNRSAFKILRGKPTGNIVLGRPRCRWEDNIRMDVKEICINTRNWVDSSEDRDYLRALSFKSYGVSYCYYY